MVFISWSHSSRESILEKWREGGRERGQTEEVQESVPLEGPRTASESGNDGRFQGVFEVFAFLVTTFNG